VTKCIGALDFKNVDHPAGNRSRVT